LISAGYETFPQFIKTRQYALYNALKYGHNDWAKFLLSVGTDPSMTDYSGKNAFDIAVDSKNEQGIQLLLAHGLAQRRDSVE
jgi:ankyrin repeat protein